MKNCIEISKLLTEITDRGFVHLKSVNRETAAAILQKLGEIIQETQIRENSNSSRMLSSNNRMGLHTDHRAANYVAWFCNSQAAVGGETLLLDTKNVLPQLPASAISALKRIQVSTHKVFYGDSDTYPLLSKKGESYKIYYAPWLLNKPKDRTESEALGLFEQALHKGVEINNLISEGELLILDNNRMLHGRSGFPKNSNRWLTRFWIK